MKAQSAPDLRSGDELYGAARTALESGQPEAALDCLDQARVAFLDEGAPLASMRTALGRINVLDDLARNTESIDVAQALRRDLSALDISELSEDERDLHAWLSAAAVENLGATLGLVGRHARAVEAHTAARSLYAAAGTATDMARVRANMGVDLIHLGGAERATWALAHLVHARDHFTAVDNSLLVARCLMYESRALALMGEYGRALDRLAMAPSRVRSESAETIGPDTLRLELTRAAVLETLNLSADAIELCVQLGPEFRRRKMHRDLAIARSVESRALLGLGRSDEATAAAREAVDLFEHANLDVRAAGARITMARCLSASDGCAEIDKALRVLLDSGEMQGVAEAALVGAELADSLGDRERYLTQAVEAGSLDAPETRWRTLWQQSQISPNGDLRRDLLDEALQTLGTLQDSLDLDRLRAPFMVNRRDPLEARLQAHLDTGEVEGAYVLSATYRALALRKPSGRRTAELSNAAETTLLYQTIGDRLVCFIAHPQPGVGEPVVELIDLGDVVPTVNELMIRLEAEWRHLSDPRLRVHIEALRGATESVLQQLHCAVFAAVEPRLGPGRITVVPTGRLSTLPFAALHDGASYLIDRRAVSVSPGVPQVGRTSFVDAPSTLVVGVPDHLAPAIETEASQVAEVTGGRLVSGANATADAVRIASSTADVLHFASHSVFRSDNPWLSSVRLHDREVTAAELAEWDLTEKTVVLASCSSGRQSSLGDDEVLGLPRALIVAGARTVLVCLWAVDDVASVGLMSQFHQQLRHQAPADALRAAQLACRRLHPHPYFWAGPTLLVNPLPILPSDA